MRAENILISGGRVIDPFRKTDRVTDILIREGLIKPLVEMSNGACTVIDASGMVVAPGFIDMHVHLREPGGGDAETIWSGLRSAIAGGITSVVSMANTTPPIDTGEAIESVLLEARRMHLANVFPAGAATDGRRGVDISEMEEMAKAGAAAFSDDGDYIASDGLMRQVLEKSKTLGKPVLSHCEDRAVSGDGVMHEGAVSRELDVPGIPSEAEETAAARDIVLAELTGAALNIQHVSTAGTVEMIRQAKARGIGVTAEAAPHHFTLTDEDARELDPNLKMNPPLRTKADMEAVREGIADGTIDCIASDHAPHTAEDKAKGFIDAPFGIIGMESLLPITITKLVDTGVLSLPEAVKRITINPAKILGIDRGTLTPGAPADITVFDPDEEWTIDVSKFESRSRNCPFDGMNVKGRVKYVLAGGEVKFPFKG